MLEKLMAAQERIAELEAHANELAATCQARDETIHKHWCKVMELESEVARLRVDAANNFQAGHAAGLEAGAKVADANWHYETAAAIRAMKP